MLSLLGGMPSLANAGLLDEYGADPSKIVQKEEEETMGVVSGSKSKSKSASSIEPNLRSNYYYPTNKKRYLPRIKKCSDAIPVVAESIGSGDWESVLDFATTVADDTILPMRLYTSSLTGGGTNVKVAYAKDMLDAAAVFETNQKLLVRAIKGHDTTSSSTALENMASALLDYRTVGNLLGADGGGDIPSVDDIRRAACRVQGRRFEQTVQERDLRVASK